MSDRDYQYSEAEEYFVEAWGTCETMDRDFKGMPTAQMIYDGTEVPNVKHFRFPEQTDDDGNPYVYHNVLLKLVTRMYGQYLSDSDHDLGERFDNAIQHAHNSEVDEDGVDTEISGGEKDAKVDRDGHAYILEGTKDELLSKQ